MSRGFKWVLGLTVVLFLGAALYIGRGPLTTTITGSASTHKAAAIGGRILEVVKTQHFTAQQVGEYSKQNYGATAPIPKSGVTEAVVRYSSVDPSGQEISEYARLYLPDQGNNLPVFGLAPGTTGIDDHCAASLEQPQVKNWANYQSHMLTYAGQGYAAVVPDYEGMRDQSRLHHYMVGELEGRAYLDSVRALRNWPSAQSRINPNQLFLSGYSQGGHAALWADKIAAKYAPELKISGVIGFGPVTSVEQTWADITRGANINWFGPYVLISYLDYYRHAYPLEKILQPKWREHLRADVLNNCIDTNISYWGRTPAQVYTPKFLSALGSGNLANNDSYRDLAADLKTNEAADSTTSTPKLLNQGVQDNVILPSQTSQALAQLCKTGRSKVELRLLPQATHYNTMVLSFHDTLAWMELIAQKLPPPNSCPAS